jgi:diguanylate cyclase (GGDEF)-like protein
MVTLFILIPAVLLFIVINTIIACYVTIRLGYGPPNWQTALNLVVPITTFQDRLNEGRDWVDKKAPWADKLLTRLHVPKPIVLIEIIEVEEEDEEDDDELLEELAAVPIEELLAGQQLETQQAETEAWLVQCTNAETSLLRLNAVLMKSGQFAAELEERIRVASDKVTEDSIKSFITDLKADCQNFLTTQSGLTAQVSKRIGEFGEFRAMIDEAAFASADYVTHIETMIKNIDTIENIPAEDGAKRLVRELVQLRSARHQLRDMRERIFSLVAAKEQRFDKIPKQLFVDNLSGQRGRIGLMETLDGWWKAGRQKGRHLAFALIDFAKFGELNDTHGTVVCDKIIKHFGGILKEQFESKDLIGVYHGNAFLIVMVQADVQKTVETVEHIRQRQAKTVYRSKDHEQPIQTLLTGAVVEITDEQSIDEVFGVLDKTMAAAKSAGRNHTFCWSAGSDQPQNADAPDFGEQGVEVMLE